MENLEEVHIFDMFIKDKDLNEQIRNTNCLKRLYVLLNLKIKRLQNRPCDKITFPLCHIYEQDSDNLSLQCEVLKLALSIIENQEQEIENVFIYLNCLIGNSFNLPVTKSLKFVNILNELLSCNVQNKDILKQFLSVYIHKFLVHNLVLKNSSVRLYILSHILHKYLNLLDVINQVDFLTEIFLHCKFNNDLDIMCIVCSYLDVTLLIKNKKSIIHRVDFWEYLGDSICLLDNNSTQKQAVFLLKKIIEVYHDDSVLNINIPILDVTGVKSSTNTWLLFFTLLECSKENQLHLIWPSIKLLSFIKCLNMLWQNSIYKLLLNHPQDCVVLYVIHYIFKENIVSPGLFHDLLSAINKIDPPNIYISEFESLPLFCNNLKEKDFLCFINHLVEISWCPIIIWHFFNNLFCPKLEKMLPLMEFTLIFKRILKVPHIYIRNGCAKILITYFVNNYKWKDSTDSIFKMILLLRDYNENVFINVIQSHIDIHFINSVKEMKWIMNKDNLKEFEAFVQIIKILKVHETFNLVLENIRKYDDELLVVLYANNFDYFCKPDMGEIIEKIDNFSQLAVDNTLNVINNLMKDNDFSEKMYVKVIDVLFEPSSYSRNVIYVTLYVAIHFFKTSDAIKIIVDNWKDSDFLRNNKFDEDIVSLFCELYFFTIENCDMVFLENICNSQSDQVIARVFETFLTIAAPKSSTSNLRFLEIGTNILLGLKKSKYFNESIHNYINCLFLVNWSNFSCEIKTLNMLTYSMERVLQFADTYPLVAYYLSTNIRNFISRGHCDSKCLSILIPVIVEILLKNIINKKGERVEYKVCQDIYEILGDAEDHPNIKKMVTRLCPLDSMLEIITKRNECADDFASCLIEKYKIHFNKRYFPDSQIHLQKLRIMQALLIIHPFINNQRQSLVDLIMESFCIEIHQPCVKQLMQWLLFFLLKDEDNMVQLLADKIESTTKTQPSTVAAYIWVLLYVTFTKSEPFWSSVVEALLPWCMGPHFKLRVYSQEAIKTLYMEAKKRCYQDFMFKYNFLNKSVNFVIEASGQAYQDTLKADQVIFNSFDPNRDYSLQTILIDIPKLNGVMENEWENIPHYKFGNYKHIPILNEDKTFANSITKNRCTKKNCKQADTIFESNFNIQRKITPLKCSVKELENHRQLGDFILIASLIDKPTNLGGLSRTCEVFGAKQLVLNDVKITKDSNFKGLSMTSESWVEYVEVKVADLKKFIFELREKDYCIVGAEQTSESVSLNEYKFKKRTALVLGNEKEGIPPDLIPIMNVCVEIPQLGLVRSLNVHVAGATFIWEYAKQHLIQ